MKQNLILIAHGDQAFAREATSLLEADKCRVDTATEGQQALSKLRQLSPTLILTDVVSSTLDTFELLRTVRAEQLATTILLVTAAGSEQVTAAAFRAGAYDSVTTPIQRDSFLSTVRRALERQQLLDELRSLRQAIEGSQGYVLGFSESGISLEGVERELLTKALDRFGGNQTRAAKYLDISRRTLIYRMEKFGLKRRGGALVSLDVPAEKN